MVDIVRPGSIGVPEDGAVFQNEVESIAKEFKKRMAKKGKLGLPPLLDKHRLKYAIPNEAFDVQACFDRIFLWQIAAKYNEPKKEGEDVTYGDTSIIMPHNAIRRTKEEAPRGVLVSAGLEALDNLRSNGIDLGFRVNFIRTAPWRMPITMVNGKEFYLMMLRDGDILGSEDLMTNLKKKQCKVELVEREDGTAQHYYKDDKGKVWDPTMPWIADDF